MHTILELDTADLTGYGVDFTGAEETANQQQPRYVLTLTAERASVRADLAPHTDQVDVVASGSQAADLTRHLLQGLDPIDRRAALAGWTEGELERASRLTEEASVLLAEAEGTRDRAPAYRRALVDLIAAHTGRDAEAVREALDR